MRIAVGDRVDEEIISLDGGTGTLVSLYQGEKFLGFQDATAFYFALDVEPGSRRRIGIKVDNLALDTSLGPFAQYPAMDKHSVLVEFCYLALGLHLDVKGVPDASANGASATRVILPPDVVDGRRIISRASDSALLSYLRAKCYWAWKLGLPFTTVRVADAVRLGVSFDSLMRVSRLGDPADWTVSPRQAFQFSLVPTGQLLQRENLRRESPALATDSSVAQLLTGPRYAAPANSWRESQACLAQDLPDLRGALREAVHTVEGVARIVLSSETETLGQLVKVLRAKHGLDPALAKALDGLWGFASESPGVRHGATTLDAPDANHVALAIGYCEAGISYLLRLDRQLKESAG